MCRNALNQGLALFLFCFLFSSFSFSQKNFLEGSITTHDGETKEGLINYQNWEKNPNQIEFKTNTTSAVQKYSPKEIKEFKVKDEIYVGANVEKEMSSHNVRKMTSTRDLILQKEDLFLQTMIQGDKNLYHFLDKNGKDFFYIKEDGEYKLLAYKKYRQERGDKEIVSENNIYVSQLSKYLNDCSSLQKQLKDTKYKKESLEKLFLFYYDCTSTTVIFQKKTEKAKTNFGVSAGISLAQAKIIRGASFPNVNIDYPSSIFPVIGINAETTIPRSFQKISIYYEFLVTKYRFQAEKDIYDDPENYIYINDEFGMTYLNLNGLVRYYQDIGSLKIFVNAGASGATFIQHKNSRTTQDISQNIETISEKKLYNFEPHRIEVGAIGGLGIKWKKFSSELRLERGINISTVRNFSFSTQSFFLLFGYHF